MKFYALHKTKYIYNVPQSTCLRLHYGAFV